jgi:hypothetical protein
MSVYVDEIRTYPSGEWCHLFADSDAELHEFARRIGLRRSWVDYHSGMVDILHYDLRPHTRALAVQYGAVEVRAKDYIARKRKEKAS